MSSEWIRTRIGQQATLQRGFDITKAAQRPGPIPVVSSAGISSWHDTAMVKGPGVVLGRKGVVGSVHYVEEDFWPHDTSLWVKDFHGNAPLFVYYFFLSRAKDLSALDVGSANPTLNRNHVHPIEVSWPSLKEQVAIGAFLGAIDDRIALLRETNATLEAIAQALFKSWFVDFDPVRAKQQGRPPESLDPTTAALFPDDFEDTELGPVPKGWQRLPFTETINVIGGGTPKTSIAEYWNGDIPWYSVVDAPAHGDVFVIDTEKHISEDGLKNSSTKLLPIGTTIISARGTVGKLALAGQVMAMNQSCYGLSGKAGDAYFTYFSTCRLVETLKQRTHGSVFDTITRDTLSGVSVIYPQKEIIDAFETVLQPVLDRIKENLKQAQTLATLRDTLLPRLISGQLRLPEAKSFVEEATA